MASETPQFDMTLDGSLLEGGGQVLRNGVALSVLLGRRTRFVRIRAGRRKPGLRAQHLCGIDLAARLCGGTHSGVVFGEEMDFFPGAAPPVDPDAHVANAAGALASAGKRKGKAKKGRGRKARKKERASQRRKEEQGVEEEEDESAGVAAAAAAAAGPVDGRLHVHAEVGTAGSCMLVTQAALPVALFSTQSVSLHIKGGTNAIKAPFVDYTAQVFVPTVRRLLGVEIEVYCHVRGWFPQGGGTVEIIVPEPIRPPATLPNFELMERGHITKITGIALTAGRLPVKVAHALAAAAKGVLEGRVDRHGNGSEPVPVEIDARMEKKSGGSGACIMLLAHTSTGCILATSALLERKAPAEEVGKQCAEELLAEIKSGACVDEHMQDQLIIFMALAAGRSRFRSAGLTLHTRTAIHWATEFGATFEVDKNDDGTCTVTCDGIGYTSRF